MLFRSYPPVRPRRLVPAGAALLRGARGDPRRAAPLSLRPACDCASGPLLRTLLPQVAFSLEGAERSALPGSRRPGAQRAARTEDRGGAARAAARSAARGEHLAGPGLRARRGLVEERSRADAAFTLHGPARVSGPLRILGLLWGKRWSGAGGKLESSSWAELLFQTVTSPAPRRPASPVASCPPPLLVLPSPFLCRVGAGWF